MFFGRKPQWVAAWALTVLCAAARLEAAPIFEPNNTAAKATVLNSRQFVVTDSLSANVGRPDTLLAQYDPTYRNRGLTDDNSSTEGNGTASALFGVPLRSNGSAYFRVTGVGDTGFNGGHTQSGEYTVDFLLYDSGHNFIEKQTWPHEDVRANMVDNVWVDPPSTPDPRRVGGTVDVIVNNIYGPGSGDSLDFFQFSGLVPNQVFSATLTVANFNPFLGLFDDNGHLIANSNPLAGTQTLTGVANSAGKAILGVTGRGDSLFKGAHIETGQYTLVLTQAVVPEPASTVLLGVGGALAGLGEYRRRRRRERSTRRALDPA